MVFGLLKAHNPKRSISSISSESTFKYIERHVVFPLTQKNELVNKYNGQTKYFSRSFLNGF